MDCNFKEKKTTLTGSSYIYCGLTSFDMKCPGEIKNENKNEKGI